MKKGQDHGHLNWESHQSLKKVDEGMTKILLHHHNSHFPFAFPLYWFLYEKVQDPDWESHQSSKKSRRRSD